MFILNFRHSKGNNFTMATDAVSSTRADAAAVWTLASVAVAAAAAAAAAH